MIYIVCDNGIVACAHFPHLAYVKNGIWLCLSSPYYISQVYFFLVYLFFFFLKKLTNILKSIDL